MNTAAGAELIRSDNLVLVFGKKWQPAISWGIVFTAIAICSVPELQLSLIPVQGFFALIFLLSILGSCGPTTLARRALITYVLGMTIAEASFLTLYLGASCFMAVMGFCAHAPQAIVLMILQFWFGAALLLLTMDASAGLWLIASNLFTTLLLVPVLLVTAHMFINKELTTARRIRWLALHFIFIALLCPWPTVNYGLRWLRWGKNVPFLPPPISEDVAQLTSK